jgi:hypothetical protein
VIAVLQKAHWGAWPPAEDAVAVAASIWSGFLLWSLTVNLNPTKHDHTIL